MLLKQKMYLAHSMSTSNSASTTDLNSSKRLQQSPLEIRSKNRAPTPGRIQAGNDGSKIMELKLSNLVNNRSASLKKHDPKGPSDENLVAQSFDTQGSKGKIIVRRTLK